MALTDRLYEATDAAGQSSMGKRDCRGNLAGWRGMEGDENAKPPARCDHEGRRAGCGRPPTLGTLSHVSFERHEEAVCRVRQEAVNAAIHPRLDYRPKALPGSVDPRVAPARHSPGMPEPRCVTSVPLHRYMVSLPGGFRRKSRAGVRPRHKRPRASRSMTVPGECFRPRRRGSPHARGQWWRSSSISGTDPTANWAS